MKSMTGFGRTEYSDALMRFQLDIKSYNNRYLDLYIQLPSHLSPLEGRIREYLSRGIVHGKVELSLKLREYNADAIVRVDTKSANACLLALQNLVSDSALKETVTLSHLLSVEGLISFDKAVDLDDAWSRVEPALIKCFTLYDESRIKEGKALVKDILAMLNAIEKELLSVKSQVPVLEETIKNNLKERFKEVLGNVVDENRVLAETAVLLVKYSISEETVRLAAHIQSFKDTLEKDKAPGKKLDFIAQEMNREINTIGSKSNILSVSQSVVSMKDALENIREQIRNLE